MVSVASSERSGHTQDRSAPGGRPRRGSQQRGGQRNRQRRAPGPEDSSRERAPEPAIDEDVQPSDLDRGARARLRTLSKENADRVAQHLVMAGSLIDSEPELAYEHAQAAMRRASRVDVVREAVALTAYALGRYGEALRELRTVRRLSGLDVHRAIEADCERGLGRPERALAVAGEAPARMSAADRVELAIVTSGARLDLDQPQAALLELEEVEGLGGEVEQTRLDTQRVTVLEALGRNAEADRIRARLPHDTGDVVFGELVQTGPEGDEELQERAP